MKPTLIMTRPGRQGIAFAERLKGLLADDARIIQSPLLDIVPMEATLPDAAGLVFTSVNGVAQAARLAAPHSLPAYCVGPKTSNAAQAAGFSPVTGPGDAEGLIDAILNRQTPGPLAHIRGRHARGAVAQTLTKAGVLCHDVIAYTQVPRALSDAAAAALAGKFPVVLPLFSPRTATILADAGPFAAPLHIAAISPAAQPDLTADQIEIAVQPTEDAMIDATIACLRRAAQEIG